jgi:ABC-2 type transport system permease protein
LEYDFRNFFRYKWWIAGMISMNLADLIIMAVVYTNMVSQEVSQKYLNYFLFFSPGITITALFAAAFMIGREINRELRREISHYLLSLPFSRWELAFGRVLSGGLRGMVYMAPLLITTIFITWVFTGNIPSVLGILIILTTLFLVSVGTSGLSITMSLSTRSFEKFVTARGVVYYILFFCSSVFYPLDFIQQLGRERTLPQFLVLIAEMNPLSSGADTTRAFLFGHPAYSPFMLLNVALFALIFVLTASFAYLKILQG